MTWMMAATLLMIEWSSPQLQRTAQAVVILVVGLLAARAVKRVLERLLTPMASAQSAQLLPRFAGYTLVALTAFATLADLGFDLRVLLGAAGVLTVALGFASQTSASNLISGLFLLGERSFVVGDVIKIGETTGAVLSIDLMSVKLRTFDNLLVRVPNESMLKAEITNLTHFPIRRLDLKIRVGYREDLDRVRGVLIEVADRNPLCLDEPAPRVFTLGFGESSIDLQMSVWAARERFLDVRDSVQGEIKRALDAEGIEQPLPHRTLYVGRGSPPLPVTLDPKPEPG